MYDALGTWSIEAHTPQRDGHGGRLHKSGRNNSTQGFQEQDQPECNQGGSGEIEYYIISDTDDSEDGNSHPGFHSIFMSIEKKLQQPIVRVKIQN